MSEGDELLRRSLSLNMNNGDAVINAIVDDGPGQTRGVTDLSFHVKHPVPLDQLGNTVSHMADMLRSAVLQQIADEIKAEVLGDGESARSSPR